MDAVLNGGLSPLTPTLTFQMLPLRVEVAYSASRSKSPSPKTRLATPGIPSAIGITSLDLGSKRKIFPAPLSAM